MTGSDAHADAFAGEEPRDSGTGSSGQTGKHGRDGKHRRRLDAKGRLMLVLGIVLLAAALGIVGYVAKGYLEARSEYSDAREAAGIDTDIFDAILDDLSLLSTLDIDWEELWETNPDVVGWIYVQGTSISYPIVQGDDNSYYLKHTYSGAYSSSGAIFLDCDNSSDFTDVHNILYGHHMRDGSMFKQIVKFKDQDFLDEGYKILIATPDYAYVLQPAFAYVCSGSDQVRQLTFSSDGGLQEYMQELMEDAVSQADVDFDGVDKLFSLVTCSYEADDVRTVLCCVQAAAVTFADGS